MWLIVIHHVINCRELQRRHDKKHSQTHIAHTSNNHPNGSNSCSSSSSSFDSRSTLIEQRSKCEQFIQSHTYRLQETTHYSTIHVSRYPLYTLICERMRATTVQCSAYIYVEMCVCACKRNTAHHLCVLASLYVLYA